MKIILEDGTMDEFIDRIAEAVANKLRGSGSALSIDKLDAIEQKLNQLFVPVVNEKARQLLHMPVEDRKKHQREHLKELRKAEKKI